MSFNKNPIDCVAKFLGICVTMQKADFMMSASNLCWKNCYFLINFTMQSMHIGVSEIVSIALANHKPFAVANCSTNFSCYSSICQFAGIALLAPAS